MDAGGVEHACGEVAGFPYDRRERRAHQASAPAPRRSPAGGSRPIDRGCCSWLATEYDIAIRDQHAPRSPSGTTDGGLIFDDGRPVLTTPVADREIIARDTRVTAACRHRGSAADIGESARNGCDVPAVPALRVSVQLSTSTSRSGYQDDRRVARRRRRRLVSSPSAVPSVDIHRDLEALADVTHVGPSGLGQVALRLPVPTTASASARISVHDVLHDVRARTPTRRR